MIIKCPDASLSRNERIEALIQSMSDWIYSDDFMGLMTLFHSDIKITGTIQDDIVKIHDFVRVWDYRQGRERWAVEDESFVLNNSEYIMNRMKGLGLVGHENPTDEADYILPLGGARMANHTRPEQSKRIIEKLGWKNKKIIALSGLRPISDAENSFVEQYTRPADTEFDAISIGMENAFGLSSYSEERIDDDNPNLVSIVRKYDDKFEGCECFSLAAPSSEPEKRRANSYDTFKYLLEQFKVPEKARILLVTSCIYVPFQFLKFMDLAIDNSFSVDCVGSDSVGHFSLSKPSNYLQEVKGTVDAIYSLVVKFCPPDIK